MVEGFVFPAVEQLFPIITPIYSNLHMLLKYEMGNNTTGSSFIIASAINMVMLAVFINLKCSTNGFRTSER